MTGALIHIAAESQLRFDGSTSSAQRRKLGHFGTPPVIADFMAGMFSKFPAGTIRILDAGAGVGTLSAAICQRILAQNSPQQVYLELWEIDPKLEIHLRRTMEHCRVALCEAGHDMQYVIRTEDFILENSQTSLFDRARAASFHFAILNPPYGKLRKESPQARAMRHVIHGQPNVYSLFMAIAADLLLPGGELVAITPRSYFSGRYFKLFRKWLFDRVVVRKIHLFESRSEAFRDDDVLQENVIVAVERNGRRRDVVISSSTGRNLEGAVHSSRPYDKVIDMSTDDRVVRVTANRFEQEIVEALDSLPDRFRELGLQVSTGPVVTFRSTQLLRFEQSIDTAPLLWMHSVRPFSTVFPRAKGKPGHILVSEDSKRLLVPAKRYLLLRRFTAKEERKRVVAGIMECTDSYSQWVGLENHLNYVYGKGSELTRAEAWGLAAYFNSTVVDRYFRAMSGNTQVNATEIRALPVPDRRTLVEIGQAVEPSAHQHGRELERIVGGALNLPSELIKQLCELAK